MLHERNRLADPQASVNEKWLTELLGEPAVRAILADAKHRGDAKLKLMGIVVPPWPHEPRDQELGLSDEALAYWNAVRQAKAREPELKRFEPSWARQRIRKLKLRMPKRLRFVAGHVVFEPKLSERESFVASLSAIAEAYEQLPENERAKFTTCLAPEMAGLRFPQPVQLAQVAAAKAAYKIAADAANAVRSEVTRQAWLDGLDKAIGRNTGGYKVGGRLRVENDD
jgi:hypothetical protein